jgi:hypothetical protein
MERIVVGGDYTPAATAALRWAVAEAALTGACVVVVHAFDPHQLPEKGRALVLDRARRDDRYRTQSWVVEVLADMRASVPVVVSTPESPVEDALVDAGQRAQMIVIGRPRARQHGGLAQHLAKRLPCPVLTVAGDDHVSLTAV